MCIQRVEKIDSEKISRKENRNSQTEIVERNIQSKKYRDNGKNRDSEKKADSKKK